MKSYDKPYILHVAEIIYLEIAKIKRENNVFSNSESINKFIDKLKVSDTIKKELKQISPYNYTGI